MTNKSLKKSLLFQEFCFIAMLYPCLFKIYFNMANVLLISMKIRPIQVDFSFHPYINVIQSTTYLWHSGHTVRIRNLRSHLIQWGKIAGASIVAH